MAALLNAAHPDVQFMWSVTEVIVALQEAVLSGDAGEIEATKDMFESENKAGCPLN